MTEQQTTEQQTDPSAATETAANSTESEQAPGTTTETTPTDDGKGGNKEAAKYRTQLRTAETERDALSTRLESMQRAEAERLAGDRLEKGAGLWANGATLPDLLDDDGNVDPDKVTAAATAAQEALGLQERRSGPYVPGEGRNPGTPRLTGTNAMVRAVMGSDE